MSINYLKGEQDFAGGRLPVYANIERKSVHMLLLPKIF